MQLELSAWLVRLESVHHVLMPFGISDMGNKVLHGSSRDAGQKYRAILSDDPQLAVPEYTTSGHEYIFPQMSSNHSPENRSHDCWVLDGTDWCSSYRGTTHLSSVWYGR